MFGSYRLVLALLVALSHCGLTLFGFNPGQWAVICFYVLSGFLMERQFKKLSVDGGVTSFYIDRFLRIYPVYFVVTALCAMAMPIGFRDTLINFTLLPQNYAAFTGVPTLVGAAWSLACEVHFYVLVPLLTQLSNKALRIIIALSLTLFAFSVFLPNNAFWAYGGIPGILFAFLSGMLINRSDWQTLIWTYVAVFTLFAAFSSTKMLSIVLPTGININVCLGYMCAIPSTVFLSKLSPKVEWDKFAGLFSYPLFLIHMLVLHLCLERWRHPSVWTFIGLSLLASGVLVLVVEKPSDLLRYRVRKPKLSSNSRTSP